MDTSKYFGRKLIDAIKFPLKFLKNTTNEEQFFSPNNSLEDIRNATLPNSPFMNMVSNDLMLIEKKEYEELTKTVSKLKVEKNENSSKEQEYKNLLLDFDTTLSFYIEKEEANKKQNDENLVKETEKTIERLNKKIEFYENNEKRLKEHIKGLESDLINCEERAEVYKSIAMEKIEVLKMENEKLKALFDTEKRRSDNLYYKNNDLERQIEDLERMLSDMSLEKNEIEMNFKDELEK